MKIGDFGLAAKIDYEGESYIGRECNSILIIFYSRYTLLVGKPPFETKSLKETYLPRIKRNDYFIPPKVSPAAQSLIVRLLRLDLSSAGFAPTRLPLSCLTMAPRFYEKKTATSTSGLPRKPLSLVNKDGCGAAAGLRRRRRPLFKASSVLPLPPTPTEFSPCMRFGGRG